MNDAHPIVESDILGFVSSFCPYSRLVSIDFVSFQLCSDYRRRQLCAAIFVRQTPLAGRQYATFFDWFYSTDIAFFRRLLLINASVFVQFVESAKQMAIDYVQNQDSEKGTSPPPPLSRIALSYIAIDFVFVFLLYSVAIDVDRYATRFVGNERVIVSTIEWNRQLSLIVVGHGRCLARSASRCSRLTNSMCVCCCRNFVCRTKSNSIGFVCFSCLLVDVAVLAPNTQLRVYEELSANAYATAENVRMQNDRCSFLRVCQWCVSMSHAFVSESSAVAFCSHKRNRFVLCDRIDLDLFLVQYQFIGNKTTLNDSCKQPDKEKVDDTKNAEVTIAFCVSIFVIPVVYCRLLNS